MGLLKKYLRPGSAHLLMCAIPLEIAYHGIRRNRYAVDRYALPVQTHFFNSPTHVPKPIKMGLMEFTLPSARRIYPLRAYMCA